MVYVKLCTFYIHSCVFSWKTPSNNQNPCFLCFSSSYKTENLFFAMEMNLMPAYLIFFGGLNQGSTQSHSLELVWSFHARCSNLSMLEFFFKWTNSCLIQCHIHPESMSHLIWSTGGTSIYFTFNRVLPPILPRMMYVHHSLEAKKRIL